MRSRSYEPCKTELYTLQSYNVPHTRYIDILLLIQKTYLNMEIEHQKLGQILMNYATHAPCNNLVYQK